LIHPIPVARFRNKCCPADGHSKTVAATKQGRLLIVDDDVELKSALCETLADEGYDTVGATSGAQGCWPVPIGLELGLAE
jgi:PleD family two-component response regulator